MIGCRTEGAPVEKVDDGARRAGALPGEGLGKEEGRPQVDGKVPVPGLHGRPLQVQRLEDRGGVDQPVDRAELGPRPRQQPRRFIRLLEVGLDRGGLSAESTDFLNGRCGFGGGGAVMDHDVGAGLGQGIDQRTPDAAGATGNQGDVAGTDKGGHPFHSSNDEGDPAPRTRRSDRGWYDRL